MSGYGYGDYQGGGGFLNTAFESADPNSSLPTKKRSGAESLYPVTIKQINSADQPHQDADVRIDGVEVKQLTFVGVIRKVNERSTNMSWEIEDGTGLVEVRKFIDNDESTYQANLRNEWIEGRYVRVVGNFTTFQGKSRITAHHIRTITDFNEVHYHLLEALETHLKATIGHPAHKASSAQANGTALANSVYSADRPVPSGQPSLGNPLWDAIMDIVNRGDAPQDGYHVNVVTQQLNGRFPPDAVQEGIEYLCQEGHLYNSIDDFHIKSTSEP